MTEQLIDGQIHSAKGAPDRDEHPIKAEFDAAYALVGVKAHDYAEDDNVFSNFEFAAQVAGISVEQVFMVMIAIKVARLGQLIGNNKEPNNESIGDTLLDMMNYPGLLKAYMKQQSVNEELASGGWDELVARAKAGTLLPNPVEDPTFQPFGDPFVSVSQSVTTRRGYSVGDKILLTDTRIYRTFGRNPDDWTGRYMPVGPYRITDVALNYITFRDNDGAKWFADYDEIRHHYV